MKKWKKSSLLLVLILCLCLLFTGCGAQKDDAIAKEDTPKETGAKEPEFVLKMQTIHGNAQLEFGLYKQIADDIFKASNGRLKIEVYPNGTFASSTEGFNACINGVIDVLASYPSWMKGIDYSFQVMTTGNMQMEATDKWVWIKEYGGQELMQKAFDKVNLKLVTYQLDGSEVLMARAPYKDIAELTGKKIRTSDPRLMAKNGVAAITLPLEELFTAFSTGAVDAAEFGYLAYDKALGLTDVADYAIYPDFWNCHNSIAIVANNKTWEKLPDDLKMIFELGFKSREFEQWTKSQFESAKVLKEFQENGKLEFVRLNAENFAKMRKDMYEIEQEDIQKYGGLTKEMYESYYEFWNVWYPYKDLSKWWGAGLKPDEMIGE